jgi:hypothetical protein
VVKVKPELIREQATALGIAAVDERRAQTLAADIERLYEALLAARDRLDFNDEPARYFAVLAGGTAPPAKRK